MMGNPLSLGGVSRHESTERGGMKNDVGLLLFFLGVSFAVFFMTIGYGWGMVMALVGGYDMFVQSEKQLGLGE
jgi:hypothetical protein